MNRMNQGAMVDLRHIVYDVMGNLAAYLMCIFLYYIVMNQTAIPILSTALTCAMFIILFILCGKSMRLYDTSTFYYPDRVTRIVLACCLICSTTLFTLLYFWEDTHRDRYFYALYFLLAGVAHLLVAYIAFRQNHKRTASSHTLLIGHKSSFEKFKHYIGQTNMPFEFVGHMCLAHDEGEDEHEYIGCVEDGDLDRIVRSHVVDQVYVIREPGRSKIVNYCIDTCLELGIVTRVILPMDRDDCSSYISSLGNYPVISYHMGSLNIVSQALKRVMDILGSLVGIVLSLPFLLFAAIWIKVDSPGPVFFMQMRVGQNGRRFKIIKLRTMSIDAERHKKDLLHKNEMDDQFMFKIKEDPRITKAGVFLRKTSIDELPQFINVLIGEMSLVGTRPPTEDEVEKYERGHWQRLRTKPGITGLWQISGRNNITSFDEVVRLDTQYIRSWSLFSDLRILILTVVMVLRRKGAH